MVSSAYICCHTHSSSALPTCFSPSLLLPMGVQTQPPQGTGASVLLSARLRADTAPQTKWQHENGAHFTSLHPPRNPDKSFACSGFILACHARRACSWVIWGELSGQPACVLQAGTAHELRAKGLFWGYSQQVQNSFRGRSTPERKTTQKNGEQLLSSRTGGGIPC